MSTPHPSGPSGPIRPTRPSGPSQATPAEPPALAPPPPPRPPPRQLVPPPRSRTVVARCPDWPLVAAGLAAEPAAVLRANRVVACSAPARAEGVRLRQRRREAEAACPGLVVCEDNPGRDVRAFEAVVSGVTRLTPKVEVSRPGVCSFPARGPARYFGGEEALAHLVSEVATAAARTVGGPMAPECQIGIADTPFAARLAARSQAIVAPGPEATARFLAPLPVGALGPGSLTDLLGRLGISELGQFAEMDGAAVAARFGAEGARAHRLAQGLDDHRLELEDPPPDLCVARELDEPLDHLETVAFLAAHLADELVSRLAARGLACTRLYVEASTEHAEERSRWWRLDRPFTARTMVDRVRWQLEGWLTSTTDAPSAGITFVRLTAGEVTPDSGRQLGLLGEPAASLERVERAVARVQGLLGHESIGTAVLTGGRGPAEQARFVPYGEPRDPGRSESRGGPGRDGDSADSTGRSGQRRDPAGRSGQRRDRDRGRGRGQGQGRREAPSPADQPWPGRLPPPAPSVVYQSPLEVSLRDGTGRPVEVSGRGRLSGRPERLFLGPGREYAVAGWAGPWPSDERWWDPALHRRRARMQVLLGDGSAHVLVLESGRWGVEASYD